MKENVPSKKSTEERTGDWKQFRRFFKQVKLSWGFIILTLVFSIVYYAAVSFIPGSTAELYAGEFTTAAIMGVVVNYSLTLVLSLASAVLQLFAEGRSVRSARNSVWVRMMNVKTSYYDRHKPNELLSAVTSDTEAAVSTLISVIIMVPSLLFYLLMCLMQVSAYSTKLLAVVFFLIPVYIIYGILMGRWQYRTGRSIQVRIGGLTGFLTERIRNLTLIKNFVKENEEEKAGVRASEELYKANVQYQYISGIVAGYTMVTEAVGILAAVLWGCELLRQGEVNLEAWLAFFMFVPMINTIFRQLSLMWCNVKELQGRAARLSKLMDAPQEEMNEDGTKEIVPDSIAFENVSFRYEESAPVLDGVSFTIPKGKVTAIVGESGCGKTTVLRLIEHLYEPDGGDIKCGTARIDSFHLESWRKRLSYVAQEAAIFGGTIRECLTYGVDRTVTDEELAVAAKQAEIYDFIMRQGNKFDTDLAIWGSALSGGQRQRLVIARELLKNADVLLLDEPTSALDAETAGAVSDTIFKNFAGKTIVTVTHELSFISGADQIIVLSGGKVAGCGTHRDLMADCAAYRELVEEQSYQEVFA